MKTALAFFLLVAVIAISCTHKTARGGAGLAQTDPPAPSKSDDGESESQGDESDDDDLL